MHVIMFVTGEVMVVQADSRWLGEDDRDVLMDEVRRRNLVGRAKVQKPCRWCFRGFSARELREHEPACGKNPRNVRRTTEAAEAVQAR